MKFIATMAFVLSVGSALAADPVKMVTSGRGAICKGTDISLMTACIQASCQQAETAVESRLVRDCAFLRGTVSNLEKSFSVSDLVSKYGEANCDFSATATCVR